MARTFCVTITHCKTDGDKATLGFVVANAAQGSDEVGWKMWKPKQCAKNT